MLNLIFKIRWTKLFIIVFSLFLIVFWDCGHRKPYYRQDIKIGYNINLHESEIRNRLILIGDAGASTEGEEVLVGLTIWAARIPDRTVVTFLGDNIYPAGMPKVNSPQRMDAEGRIAAQLTTIHESGARGIFIPGNHDWQRGLSGLLSQQKFITESLGDSSFLPIDGCPGPVSIDLEMVRLIIIDSDHLLYSTIPWQSKCSNTNQEEFFRTFGRLIKTSGQRKVVILAHHPLATHGPHGGFFDWQDHIFPLTHLSNLLWIPLPGIGSLYPLIRWNVVRSSQDLNSEIYQKMISQLEEAMSSNPPLIYAAGHEHVLQVLEGDNAVRYVLVSGAGSRKILTAVGHGEDTIFAHRHTGFMVLDFLKNGKVLLQVVEPGDGEIVFQKWLD